MPLTESQDRLETGASSDPQAPPSRSERNRTEQKERAWREWIMTGIGLAAAGSVLGVLVMVAALLGHPHAPTRSQALRLSAAAQANSPAGAGTAVSLQVVMKSGAEHGKLASDGRYHTAALPANLAVKAGDRVTVTVLNYDSAPHTFTSQQLNVNAIIRAGSASSPSKTTFTFSAPATAGQYLWYCSLPCDPFSMTHIGYMRGYVVVSA